MSQTWVIPIDATDTFSTSRTDLNNALDALYTNWIGTADPISGTPADGAIWVRSDTNKVRARKGGATIELGDWAAQLGHLRSDGTIALTGAMSCGSNKLTNLANGTVSTDAIAFGQVSGVYLPLAGGTMNSGVVVSYNTPPALSANNLTHKTYCDAKLLKAGDVATGRLAYSGVGASGGTADILSRAENQDLITFNTSTGHRHTGTDARKVRALDLDAGAIANKRFLMSNGSGAIVDDIVGQDSIANSSIELTYSVGDAGAATVKFSTGIASVYAFMPFLKVSNAANCSVFYLSYIGYGEPGDGGGSTSTSYNCDLYAKYQASAAVTLYIRYYHLTL